MVLLAVTNLVLYSWVFSQWKSTNGPSGGYADHLIEMETTLFVSAGGHIYKSTDKGESWEVKISGLPINAGIQDLVEDNGSLYASIYGNGIYVSIDEAESWSPVNNGIELLTFYNIMVIGSEIYAGNANGGIYYSGDKGQTWTEKSVGVSDIQFQDFIFFKSATYAGGNPLYRSINQGDTWDEVEVLGLGPNGVRSMTATETNIFLGDDGNVFISSDGIVWDKSTLNVGGTIKTMGVSGDSVYLTTGSGKFYYSKDEGLSWTMVQNTATSNFANDIILLDERIIMSTDEGLYTTFDNGNIWTASNVGINALQIESIAGTENLLFAGTERQGIFRYESVSGWTSINNGLEGPNTRSVHDIIILENEVVIGTGGGVYLSSDSGNEWVQMFNPGVNKTIETLGFDDGVFATGVNGTGIFLSFDTAKTFNLTETSGLNIETSYKSLLIKGDTIVVSTHNGEIFLSENLGQSWLDISIPGDYYFTYDLVYENDKLYSATAKGLLVSDNLGDTWKFINNDQTTVTAISVVENKIHAATSNGVFVTSETRDRWYDVSEGLGNQWANEMLLLGDTIYIGTYASSVWKLAKAEANLPPIIISAGSITSEEDTPLLFPMDKLVVDDDNIYPDDFLITLLSGENYSVDSNTITPKENFNGILNVPIKINDGIDDSPVFNLSIEVTPVNDPPKIIDYEGSSTITQNEAFTITLTDFLVEDIDNDFPSGFTLLIQDGEHYNVSGDQISPENDYIGPIDVGVVVNDGELNSNEYTVLFEVREPLGLKDDALKDQFNIYPNPTADLLTVSPLKPGAFEIQMFSSQGNLVYSKVNPNSETTINLTHLSKGLYILRISKGEEIGSLKVIID